MVAIDGEELLLDLEVLFLVIKVIEDEEDEVLVPEIDLIVVLRGKQDFLFDLFVSGLAGVVEVVHDDLMELRLVSAEELADLQRELGRQVVQELEFGQRAL